MKKNIHHTFNDCITHEPPDDISGYLVVHAKQKIDAEYHDLILYYGYLEAAGIIIKSLDTIGISPHQDIFAMPLLNLYVNAIEMILKYLVKKLNYHRELKTCSAILEPSCNAESVLISHDLIKLSNLVSEMLPKNGGIHEFAEFYEVNTFIHDICNFRINTASTRYHLKQSGSVYEFHQNQSWLNFIKLHDNIISICNKIYSYIQNDIFTLCGINEFTTQRLNELVAAKRMLLLNKKQFKEYSKKTLSINKQHIIDGSLLYQMMLDFNPERKLWNNLVFTGMDELVLLVLGLFFIRNDTTIPKFDKINRNQAYLEEKIFGIGCKYNIALTNLNNRINLIRCVIHRHRFNFRIAKSS